MGFSPRLADYTTGSGRHSDIRQDRFVMGALHIGIALSVFGHEVSAAAHDHFCSAGVAVAGAVIAAGFFRLLMMIVISGTTSRGKIPFNGW